MPTLEELRNPIPWATSGYAGDIKRWRNFMVHDFQNSSRPISYEIINNLVSKMTTPVFTEIGFGQAYDFAHCFQGMHDRGEIIYVGYDITPKFVQFAKQDYPDHDFRCGGFTDLGVLTTDIIFTRHTFEHISAELYPTCLRSFLRAAKQLAVISWARAPIPGGDYHFRTKDRIYFNTHDDWVTETVITSEGFDVTEIHVFPFSEAVRKLYVLERRKP